MGEARSVAEESRMRNPEIYEDLLRLESMLVDAQMNVGQSGRLYFVSVIIMSLCFNTSLYINKH